MRETEVQIIIQELVKQLVTSKNEYFLLEWGDIAHESPGKPCSPVDLQALQLLWKCSLPPSYHAFMELYNGWPNFFDFAGGILSVNDYKSAWVWERLKWKSDLFDEFEPVNPIRAGAFPLILGEEGRSFVLFDPTNIYPDGEMDIVEYEDQQEVERFKNLVTFLQHHVQVWRKLVEESKNQPISKRRKKARK